MPTKFAAYLFTIPLNAAKFPIRDALSVLVYTGHGPWAFAEPQVFP
jgi:hypothetical protein